MEYDESDFLQLSGIQHFAFCPRQWALIHVESQWAENLRTTEGAILHERAHDSRIVTDEANCFINTATNTITSNRRLHNLLTYNYSVALFATGVLSKN